MSKIQLHTYKSKYGELVLGDYKGELCLCDWKFRKTRKSIDTRIADRIIGPRVSLGSISDGTKAFEEVKTPLHTKTIMQLQEYFEGGRQTFDIPMRLVGSEFQKSVWNALQEIPFGKTMSYLDLSRKLGNPKAIRAVASANGANALAIIIPCHRVIGSDGQLTGYAGGLDAKRRLLQLENPKRTSAQLRFELK